MRNSTDQVDLRQSSSHLIHSPSLCAESFAAGLFFNIGRSKIDENVVFSPFSIQMALALTYLGAEGRTAEELLHALYLPSREKDENAKYFSQFLNKSSGESELNIANRLFVSSDFAPKNEFNQMADIYFKSAAQSLNFKDNISEAVRTINKWIKTETNRKITDILQPESISADTVALIVNAIYFRAKWKNPFNLEATTKETFWLNKEESVQVDFMHGMERRVKYLELPEWEATAIELPYKKSEFSMILIRPSEKDGLLNLENKLCTKSILELPPKMSVADVDVIIPRFKIEFSTSLVDILKKMGIHDLFENANLSGIFESEEPIKVSDVKHKAYLDVNEAGSEAAAAVYLEMRLMSIKYEIHRFMLDRPFVFAIKDNQSIYFIGHVVKF